jgi:hypothetical protein
LEEVHHRNQAKYQELQDKHKDLQDHFDLLIQHKHSKYLPQLEVVRHLVEAHQGLVAQE